MVAGTKGTQTMAAPTPIPKQFDWRAFVRAKKAELQRKEQVEKLAAKMSKMMLATEHKKEDGSVERGEKLEKKENNEDLEKALLRMEMD